MMAFGDNVLTGLAIDIQYVSYSYGRTTKKILKDACLQVKQGTIFGLLGPSGCGKTTLLNCVIGLISLKSGKIEVLGEVPCSRKSMVPGRGVGYMPQENALYPELSIWETLLYFGRLHRTSHNAIKERADQLLEFLDLPPKSSMVGKLSSGQQRRVSLAVALIHRPPLLILDEPTVGVDPILRRCIWDYLVKLSTQDGITTVITTHYIGEARQADTVGFMRDGSILKQINPLQELEEFNETSLEQSFLRICNDTEDNTECENPVITFSNRKTESEENELTPLREYSTERSQNAKLSPGNGSKSTTTISNSIAGSIESDWKNVFHTIGTILKNEFSRTRRNIPFLLVQFFVPGLAVLLFALSVGLPPMDLKIAIVNEESPAALSRAYLESIENQAIVQVSYPDLESATLSVKNGNAWGIIHIPINFTKYYSLRISEGIDSSNETVVGSNVHIYLDTTVSPVSSFLQAIISKSFLKFTLKAYKFISLPSYTAEFPIQMGEPIYRESDYAFNGFLIPGVILMTSFTISLGMTTLILAQDRTSKLLERTWMCKVSSFEIIVAHLSIQFVIVLVQTFISLLIVHLALKTFDETLNLAVLFLVLAGTCGILLGLLLSGVSNEPKASILAVVGQFFPMVVLSGVLWPLESQPYWIRYFSMSLPLTLPISALRNCINRGWGFQETEVWSAILIQLAWVTAFFVIGVKLFKVKK